MNNQQKIIRQGLILFVVTMALFFLLFYYFSTKGSVSESDYFNYSAMISCFVLPALYAGMAFYTVFSTARKQVLEFGQAWRMSFLTMFIGGFLSLGSIFIFFNTIGSWAEDSLQRGWYDLMTANPNPEFMEKNEAIVQQMFDSSINMFTLKVFFISFAVVLFYYLMISFIFATFFKNRRV
ncbi:MAG TPA: DUF4199 domain-containing protein [Moheibacter sp.]|nr:DUF4199 domain-containing protein [Moheibacter sp.]